MKASWFEANGFKADSEAVLVEPWSPYVGAVLLLCYLLVHYNETIDNSRLCE